MYDIVFVDDHEFFVLLMFKTHFRHITWHTTGKYAANNSVQ